MLPSLSVAENILLSFLPSDDNMFHHRIRGILLVVKIRIA